MTAGTFFSPSYIGDLERMVWLRRSIEAFHPTSRRHIIAVPRQDLKAFRNAIGYTSEVEFICQEELVDPGFYPDALYRLARKIATSQTWRFHAHAGKPGWIIQQIVKLSSNKLITDGPIIFLDSDIVFYRRFSLEHDLGLGNDKRVMVRILPGEEGAKHRHHIIHSRRFFDLPEGPTDATYMGYPAIWYADWLTAMQQHIKMLKGKPWQKALLEVDFNISEYTLYRVFIEEVLKPHLLTLRDRPFNLIAWDRASFEALKETVMRGQALPSQQIALCLQSNIHIPVSEYEDMLGVILRRSHSGNDE